MSAPWVEAEVQCRLFRIEKESRSLISNYTGLGYTWQSMSFSEIPRLAVFAVSRGQRHRVVSWPMLAYLGRSWPVTAIVGRCRPILGLSWPVVGDGRTWKVPHFSCALSACLAFARALFAPTGAQRRVEEDDSRGTVVKLIPIAHMEGGCYGLKIVF